MCIDGINRADVNLLGARPPGVMPSIDQSRASPERALADPCSDAA
jgi:hypothetical protein